MKRRLPSWSNDIRRGCDISCGSCSPSPDGAEDALQDVWLDVFRHLPRLADPQALVAWLYRIARDRAFGRLRKMRPTEPLEGGRSPMWRLLTKGTFRPRTLRAFTRRSTSFPAEQREVLVLRFLEEMSYEEIARVVGCQLGTVRSRIHYGKQALRRALQP